MAAGPAAIDRATGTAHRLVNGVGSATTPATPTPARPRIHPPAADELFPRLHGEVRQDLRALNADVQELGERVTRVEVRIEAVPGASTDTGGSAMARWELTTTPAASTSSTGSASGPRQSDSCIRSMRARFTDIHRQVVGFGSWVRPPQSAGLKGAGSPNRVPAPDSDSDNSTRLCRLDSGGREAPDRAGHCRYVGRPRPSHVEPNGLSKGLGKLVAQ